MKLGLTHRDSVLLRRESDYTPKIQTFRFEDEEEEPEERTYFCAVDESRLDYHKHLDIWICSECYQQYDTRIQDKPIKNKDGFELHAHHNPYQQFDQDDPNFTFVEGINIKERESEIEDGIEVITPSGDRRIQHVHVKGSVADPLSAMDKYEARQKQ